MMRATVVLLGLLVACNATSNENGAGPGAAPANTSWRTTIAGRSEPGERLVISGVVYDRDGKPAAGTVLYFHHTNSRGIYPVRGHEVGEARQHGYLRGWIRTNEKGQYEIDTIRPASYPNSDALQHIHVAYRTADGREGNLDEYHFDDDPLLTKAARASLRVRGGSGIVRLQRDARGIWRGARDIRLP